MRVSIVVPVRDGERYLGAALRSLLDQERPSSDEIVVADDGSSDGQAAPRRGARRARAAAADRAGRRRAQRRRRTADHGEFLGFLDADDLARPRRLALQAEALARPGLRRRRWTP